MFLFIFMLIIAVIGVALITGAILAKNTETSVRGWAGGIGIVALLLAAGVIGLSSVATVGTSDVGIVTAFGHTVGSDLGPGFHVVAPWDNVTTWDNSVQHARFEGKNCMPVRIAGQQAACLDVNLWWRDRRAASDRQFVQYRTFLRLQAALVSRGVLVRYFNNRFERFDPVALASQTAAGRTGGATVSSLAAQVESDLRNAYKNNAYIVNLSTGSPRYSGEVEAALNKVVTAKAGTNVALQNKQTAIYQAEAANTLARSHLTPLIVEQNCLNVTQTLTQAGNKLVAGWNCTGGNNGLIVSATGRP